MRVRLGLVLLPLAMQQLPPPPAPVFRSGTRLVQVNVVVHDKRGQPVADLAKADFTLLENGKPQEISFFSVDSVKAGTAAAPAPPLPSRTFTNALAAHNNVPTSVTVLLIDTLNTTVADQMRARAGLLTFLQQLQPQDRIAIFAMTPHGLALLHDFTSDSASLVERLHAAKPQVSPALETSFANATLQQDLHNMGLDALTDGEQVAADFETGNRITQSVTAMLAIAEHLAGVPGRKSLIWVSSGFPMTIGLTDMKAAPARGPARDVQLYARDLDHLSRAMNEAGIAVYPVDARGLFNPGFTDTSSRTTSRWNEMPDISAQNANTSTMFVLADKTGGRVAYSTNDIGGAVRRAIDDGAVTYTLGFYPTVAEDGKWRDIKVNVGRPGLDVRARQGYVAMPPVDQTAKTRMEAIRGAVWSPIEATALPVTAHVDFTTDPQDTVEVIVQLDPRTVSFRQLDGRWRAQLDMAFVQKDVHGIQIGEGGMDNLTIALTDENYQKVVSQGLLHRYRGRRETAAATLRVVVRDGTTGAVGSVTVPFAQVR